MAERMKKMLVGVLCVLLAAPLSWVGGRAAEETELITDFQTLMTAVHNAQDGDTLLVGDIDFSPLSPDVPNSMMAVTVEKSLTIRGGKSDGAAVFLNGGFVLSGSKLSDETLSVRFENIIFDGKADADRLTEKDYEYPWSDVDGAPTYYASLKAQQALSFMGNVDAVFSGCVFRNYMHEYGPVIDIRYADYTGNEYINLPDYSTCRLNLYLDNCRIENNSALYDGGAIYMEANNNVVLHAERCVFSGNRSKVGDFSRGGGAVWASGANLCFSDCVLDGNEANHVYADSVLPDYDTHKGGALCLEACRLRLVNCLLRENRASLGGALSLTNTQADMDGCRFLANRADPYAANPDGKIGPWSNMGMGGALYVEGNSNDTVTMVNCEMQDNFAAHAYGGMYAYYVPFEDPSLPTYNIQMLLCTYEGNRDGVDYDYTTVGDLAWLSHPGDMFANPHLTLFGCCIIDETFAADFPRNESPAAENQYNCLAATAGEDIRQSAIPAEEVRPLIGDRYGDRLTAFHVGSNYAESLYKSEEETEPSVTETEPPVAESETAGDTETRSPATETEPSISETEPSRTESQPLGAGSTPSDTESPSPVLWSVGAGVVIAVGGALIVVLLRRRRTPEAAPADETVSAEIPPEPAAVPPAVTVIKTRYDDEDIDRFLSLVPETGTLTAREMEVLREMLAGRKQSEVAYRLGISTTTVKDFYKKIYAKLHVENKDGVFAMAAEVLKK